MASTVARSVFCELGTKKTELVQTNPKIRISETSTESSKIMLQPRLCTLRSYTSGGVVKPAKDPEISPFFASLTDYIESSKKSRDFEILSGRFAMVAFATAVSVEIVTGNSIFKKLDLQQITEAAGICSAVVTCAATFAWFSSARTKIGQMFSLGCNSFVDALIDNIVEALFYESELNDWSDDI